MRNAQITVFLILGIVVTFTIFSFFFYISRLDNDYQFQEIAKTPSDVLGVRVFIESCLNNVGEEGVFFIASRGGYYDLPSIYFDASPFTAYYIIDNKDLSPAKEDIERELSKYIENQLDYCLKGFVIPGYDVIYDQRNVSTTINDKDILISMHMPILIQDRDSTLRIEDFYSSFKEDKLIRAFAVSKSISSQVEENPDVLCFTCIFNAANQNHLNVVIESYSEDTYVFRLKDQNEESFMFNFAVRAPT